MPVLITRRAPGSPELSTVKVKRTAERMLSALGLSQAELSVLLCDDARVQELNREHRGKNKPTDVLSFPLMDFDDEQLSTLAGGALGDVVISLDTAQRQASSRGHELFAEVTFLLAHGLLHLIGYDHETDAEEAEMNAATERLVASSGRARRPNPRV